MKKDIPDFVIQQIPRQMEEDRETGWGRQIVYFGPTSFIAELCLHAGVLSAHVTPHPPHCHEHEELHIALSDSLEFVGCEADTDVEYARPVDRGSMLFSDSHIPHTYRNTATQAAYYLHARWRNEASTNDPDMKRRRFYYSPVGAGTMTGPPAHGSVDTIEIYNGPSLYLPRFRALFVRLAAGGVIPLHRHSHEVIFAFVGGTVEILGRKVDAPGFAFTGTRMPHGIINHGPEIAQFYAFELHREA